MKKIIFLLFNVLLISKVLPQENIGNDKDAISYVSVITGITHVVNVGAKRISRDSVFFCHFSYYRDSMIVTLDGKEVDSLLNKLGCRNKIYPNIKNYFKF